MLVSPGIVHDNYNIEGTTCIFGKTTSTFGVEVKLYATWAGLLAFILVVVALVILLAAFILPLLKVKALDKFAGVLNLVAVVSLIVAGVFMFCIIPAYEAANGAFVFVEPGIGAGWVIGAILAIVGGFVAILPAVFDFLGKK
jgi:hypothetical protein